MDSTVKTSSRRGQATADGSNRPKPRGKASTSEILGLQAKGEVGQVPPKWAHYHAELAELREYLAGERRSRTASAQAEPSVSGQHMADTATDSYDRDWALAMVSSDQTLLYEVQEALKRMADGSYGICELTGQPIEPERLKALPWTRFSAAAQAELEGRGEITRTRLGQLGTYGSEAESGAKPEDEDLEEPSNERRVA
jgi:RNA polymerase-binding transcription factor DksA